MRFVFVQSSFKNYCVQVVSGASSEGYERSERSMRRVDKGVVMGVSEVSGATQWKKENIVCISVSLF